MGIAKQWIGVVLALCLSIASAGMPARADSWALPAVESYFSGDRQWRLEVRPRPIESQLKYFEDGMEGRDAAGGLAGASQKSAEASLQRRQGERWTTVWEGPLLNDVAPVSALVAPDGRFVTFDNWHSTGYGPKTVVIYDATGRAVRSMGLKDFLPPAYVAILGRSVSSIMWSGEHRISKDGRRVLVNVYAPQDDEGGKPMKYVDIAFDLETGRQLPNTGKAWAAAAKTAERDYREKQSKDAVELAEFTAPLRAPNSEKELDWRRYAYEAWGRLTQDSDGASPYVLVIGAGDETDPETTRGVLQELLAGVAAPKRTVMLLGPSQDELQRSIEEEAAAAPPGKLAGRRVYVVADAARYEAMAKALQRSGADCVRIDPAVAIEQRPQRLKNFIEFRRRQDTAEL